MRISLKGVANLVGWAALIGTLALCAGSIHAARGPEQKIASVCAATPPKGASKFTGRVQTVPAGSSFEVNGGKDTAVVSFSDATTICQGGQPVSAGSLVLGLAVTVYGQENKVGKAYHVAAALIFAEGNPAATRTNTNLSAGSVSGGINRTQPPPESGGDQRTSSPVGGSVQKTQGPGGSGISCESFIFNVPGAVGATSSGRGGARVQVENITCVMPIDQQSMQFMTDATVGQRMATESLIWQNVMVATLTNAFVSNVLITTSGNQPVADVTFQFAKIELLQGSSGAHITLDGKN
jgi:hypothetical protein